ncbi:MAG: DUF3109 family protein [Bacteroidales bacterium]|nr:DUF3109 family protein [Bacteroidales bacterium]
MIEIGDVLVSEDVVLEYFACDYPKCKGCCCIIGDSGAPLKGEELEPLEANYPYYQELMRPEGRAAVEAKGFFEIDRDGDLVTPLVAGSEECAFCHFDSQGNCLCAIERQFCKGLGKFRKPISCSLYPIRVVDLGGGRVGLNLHRWHICKDAYEKGRREGIRVYEFLRGPLTEAFGQEFYSALSAAAKMLIAAS